MFIFYKKVNYQKMNLMRKLHRKKESRFNVPKGATFYLRRFSQESNFILMGWINFENHLIQTNTKVLCLYIFLAEGWDLRSKEGQGEIEPRITNSSSLNLSHWTKASSAAQKVLQHLVCAQCVKIFSYINNCPLSTSWFWDSD